MTDDKIKVIFSPASGSASDIADNPFVVIYKPHGMPSAPLKDGEEGNALYYCEKLFPAVKNVHGKKEIEHGLVHRIDTDTDGLLLFALTQDAYDSFILQQREGLFTKWYRAEYDYIKDNAALLGGFPPLDGASKDKALQAEKRTGASVKKAPHEVTTLKLTSTFRPYGPGHKQVRPVIESSSNKAALKKAGTKEYTTLINIKNAIAECEIKEGYRHQVRCHLAWAGYAIKGDKLYNAHFRESENQNDFLHFTACALEFNHPVTGKKIKITDQ